MNHRTEWTPATFVIEGDKHTTSITVSGRDRWALERLLSAGVRGCTPIEEPAPRWSGYVFNLRQMGVAIETVHERHGGPFAGRHARYVLRSNVVRVDDIGEAGQ